MHPLDALLTLDRVPDPGLPGPGRSPDGSDGSTSGASAIFRGSTVPEYHNMVGPFGGATAAVTLRAAMAIAPPELRPVATTVQFAAALESGEFTVAAQVRATTRSTTHMSFELAQGGEPGGPTRVFGTTLFGSERPAPVHAEAAAPAAPAPGSLPSAHLMIPWSQRYDFRWVTGAPAFAPDPAGLELATDTRSTFWIRDAAGRAWDYPALLAVSDAFFPRVFLRYQTYVPAGTVAMTTYFHATAEDLAEVGGDFLLASATGQNYGPGWFDHVGHVWSETGKLLATTTQIVYFKAA